MKTCSAETIFDKLDRCEYICSVISEADVVEHKLSKGFYSFYYTKNPGIPSLDENRLKEELRSVFGAEVVSKQQCEEMRKTFGEDAVSEGDVYDNFGTLPKEAALYDGVYQESEAYRWVNKRTRES